MDWLEQPTDNSCGQTCLAMITGKSVEEMMKESGKRGGTRIKDLVRVLRNHGYSSADRLTRLSRRHQLPRFCIYKVWWSKDPSYTHWAIHKEGVFYDPAAGTKKHTTTADFSDYFGYKGARITSFLEIQEGDGELDERKT